MQRMRRSSLADFVSAQQQSGRSAAAPGSSPIALPPAALQLARAKAKSKRDAAEDLFAFQCRARKLPAPVRQYRFAQSIGREWRFDFAFVDEIVAVEIEGLVVERLKSGRQVVGGRHATIDGWREDSVKYANAALLGWQYVRFEQSQVKAGVAVDFAEKLLTRARAA